MLASGARLLLRLLFLSHRLPYAPNRGDRIRAYHLLRLLAACHEVHVVALVHDAAEAAEVSSLASWVASAHGAMVSRYARYLHAAFALPTSRPLTHVLLHSSEVLGTVHRLVSERQFDAVVAYGTAMARYVFEPPLRDVPCVLDMIDVDSEKWAALGKTAGAFRRPIYRREARLLRRFERQAYDRARATAVVNERELVLLNQIVGRAGGIAIPNGVDFQAFRPPSAPVDSAQVVFCGVFNYRPNEEGALWLATEVWPRVLAARPDANLVLVGAQPTKAVLRLAQTPSIKVTGTVADVRPFLWDSAVAAAPLHLARGVQNKVLEALSAGLPCVVTPPVLDGLPQGVRAGCRLASEADSFAAQLVTLLNQTPLSRRTLADTADVSSLDWAEQLRPFLGLVHDCSPSPVKA